MDMVRKFSRIARSQRTRKKSTKKRSLHVVNEYFELVFDAVIWLLAIRERFLIGFAPGDGMF